MAVFVWRLMYRCLIAFYLPFLACFSRVLCCLDLLIGFVLLVDYLCRFWRCGVIGVCLLFVCLPCDAFILHFKGCLRVG